MGDDGTSNSDGINDNSSNKGGGGKAAAHFTPEELEGIMQVAEDDDPFGLVVSSLCPSIFGHDIVKVRRILRGDYDNFKKNKTSRCAVVWVETMTV